MSYRAINKTDTNERSEGSMNRLSIKLLENCKKNIIGFRKRKKKTSNQNIAFFTQSKLATVGF